MEMIILIPCVILALAGVYALAGFALGFVGAELKALEITGFQDQKNKGRALPIAEMAGPDKKVIAVKPSKIDQISYLLSPPIEKQRVKLLVKADGGGRVFGFLSLTLGVVCMLPLAVWAGFTLDKPMLTGQLLYIAIFLCMSVGGWALLKFIQRL